MTVYASASLSSAQSDEIDCDVTCIQTYGYTDNGDGGGGLYVRVPVEPTHAGKFQSYDGAWWELRERFPNALQFGAIDDGLTTDDTAALNRLADYSNYMKVCAWLSTSVGFSTNGGHIFNHGLCAQGNGRGAILYITHPTNDIIGCASGASPAFTGIHYSAAVVRTGGFTIIIDAPAGQHAYKPLIADNVFQGGFTDILLNRANIASIRDNYSGDFRSSFLIVQNVDHPDNGDHSVIGNTWDTSYPGANSGILQHNAGGMRIIGNKGGRGAFAYELMLTGSASGSTSVLIIQGNSFENQMYGSIRMRRYPGATASFSDTQILGNEFLVGSGNPSIDIDDVGFMDRTIISDNIIKFNCPIGIRTNASQRIKIHSNILKALSPGMTGVMAMPGSSGYIGKNVFQDVAYPVNNLSPGVVVDI